jgi:hypothetical protein
MACWKFGDRAARARSRTMRFGNSDDNTVKTNEQKPVHESGIPSAASAATAAVSVTGHTATFRYVDRPELVETFADSIIGMFFDGQSLRVEFAVSRVDEIKPNTPIKRATRRRSHVTRLALSPEILILRKTLPNQCRRPRSEDDLGGAKTATTLL